MIRYTPQKNKQRLQMRKVRRKRMSPPGTRKKRDKERGQTGTLVGAEGGPAAAVEAATP